MTTFGEDAITKPSWEGKGPDLHTAAKKAAQKAKDDLKFSEPTTLEVLEIKVVVENPITDYIVLLGQET